jgi:hypothetical protein
MISLGIFILCESICLMVECEHELVRDLLSADTCHAWRFF